MLASQDIAYHLRFVFHKFMRVELLYSFNFFILLHVVPSWRIAVLIACANLRPYRLSRYVILYRRCRARILPPSLLFDVCLTLCSNSLLERVRDIVDDLVRQTRLQSTAVPTANSIFVRFHVLICSPSLAVLSA